MFKSSYNNKRYDVVTVKKYNDRYKLTYLKTMKISGLEEQKKKKPKKEKNVLTVIDGKEVLYNPYFMDYEADVIEDYYDEDRNIIYYYVVYNKSEDKVKQVNNLIRAKSTIFELASCNDWQFFCTLTLDKNKYDRYNLKKFNKDLSQFIRDLRKKYKSDIKFLLIPEMHKDGAWHMHGFLDGIPADQLQEFSLEAVLPEYLLKKIKNNNTVYNWVGYAEKFGFCVLEEIRDIWKASSYITKYISKSLNESVKELGMHSYYASKGLKRALLVAYGYFDNPEIDGINYDFENDFCKIKWMNEEEYENIKYFIDKPSA